MRRTGHQLWALMGIDHSSAIWWSGRQLAEIRYKHLRLAA